MQPSVLNYWVNFMTLNGASQPYISGLQLVLNKTPNVALSLENHGFTGKGAKQTSPGFLNGVTKIRI